MLDGIGFSQFRRGFFEPLVYKKNGSPLLQYWKELEKTQYLPEAALRSMQWQRVEEMLRFVWDNNAFYRARFEEAGITPDMLHSPEVLCRLPILTKEEIRRNTSSMISHGYDVAKLLNFKTGGSTGKSLDIYLTEECSELRNACARRHDRWTGWEVGEPVAAVWGNPHLPVSFKDKLKQRLLTPHMYLDTMSVTEEAVRNFAAEWRRAKPTLLFGHAHSIYVLAKYVCNLNISNIKPRGILSTSMMLMPHERKVIEEVFGVRVTNRYGCEEVSLIASECERHDGMHLNIEHLFIEFVKDDGTYTAPGNQGRIIVTDLLNRAMPFIRYQVEDVGVPTDRKCSCGRGLPLMEHVTGRVADFLIRKDGTRIAGVSLIENTLTKFSGIDQMQIIQETFDLFKLRVVPGRIYTESDERGLREYFMKLFGCSQVVIEVTPTILPELCGKYRFSICKI